MHPATLPGLIHAIQHEELDTFKAVLQLYQEGFSQDFIGTWPADESGNLLSPTPIEAAITARRFNVFQVLVRAGCELQLGSKLSKVLDHIRGFGEPMDRFMQSSLERALLSGSYVGLLNTHVATREYGEQTAARFLYQVLGTVAFGGR
ncbi:hypothetical protein ANO14919_035510 [Xylariales sp. No.14919]|nr:hypothetical protein ANO14919_035510 [Xylariales sp. No.14919]